MDCSLPGFSVHVILQARILDWFAISFSRGSSQPKDRTWISYIAGRFFTTEAPGKPLDWGGGRDKRGGKTLADLLERRVEGGYGGDCEA